MTRSQKTLPRPEQFAPEPETEPDSLAKHMAFACTYPEGKAARVICATDAKSVYGEPDIGELVRNIERHTELVNTGDMRRLEGMLVSQAVALESLFTHLTERAMAHTQIPGFEANMRMALRAQNQSRATIEALVSLKNPPVLFAKQANIANGPQQVNNGTQPQANASGRGESRNQPNKVLEYSTNELLDAGTKSKAGRGHPQVETVVAVHRSPQRGRQGDGCA